MRPNRVRQIWEAGGVAINGWCAIPSGFTAELMAHMGWDSLVIDTQHGLIGYQAMVEMLTAISTTDTMPMVRVAWNDPGAIMKALDAGAYGIICPMINDRAACERFVGACRYAPMGYRSSGPIRAELYGGPDYHAKANGTVLALAMIETREALDNLDAILSTPGLDGVYVGPSDLSLTLGLPPGQDKTDPVLLEAFQKILQGCARHGLKAGVHTGSAAYARRMAAMGFNLVTPMGDHLFLETAGRQAVAQMRGELLPRI
jgi:4-hydroxy-2-oxoheptanedioate aldolase